LSRRAGVVIGSCGLIAVGALLHAACENVTAKSQAATNQKPEELSQVLARIDDDVLITVGDFQNQINQQSPYVRARYTSLEKKKEFLDNRIRFEVLAKEAKTRGLDKDEEVVRTMKQVMIQKLMKEQFDSQVKLEDVSDAECKTYFDSHQDEFNKPEEVRVADILVKDDKTAKKVLADQRIKGVDNTGFRTLVAEYSQDTATKDRGGDLRYFDANTKELPSEIVKASFALQNVGDVSQVKSTGGVHVLKLTGRRKALVRTFDEVKPQIRNRLYRDKRQQSMEDFVKKLRDKAKIELHEDRLAKVVIETAGAGQPPLPTPGPGMFHPGAPGAPQASPIQPGTPPGSQRIGTPPAPAAAPPPSK
jgi:peptidyl-prolyl cis-trans isomerase C